jgi:hypothetical protein
MGAGFAVPTVEDALARITAGDTTGGPAMFRRGGTGLVRWRERPTGVALPARLGGEIFASLLAPDLRVVHNSSLPHAPNEGSLWASRGPSTRILVGVAVRTARLELTLAPEIAWSRNRAFQIYPSADPGRHPFASPWHARPHDSADLPLRPGADPLLWLHPGQSSLAFGWRGLRLGVGTENRWWGPGLGNALVLGGDAPGFAHAFVETSRPLTTPIGEVEAAWLFGTLIASPWFSGAGEVGPRARAVSGLALGLAPIGPLRLGVLRLVVRPRAYDPVAALDPVLRWDPATGTGEGGDPPETDQVISLFFRLAPAARVEVYGEWARMDPPRSFREILETPHHSQGYTLGFQWRSERTGSGRSVRVQAEATNLEQTKVRADRAIGPPFYTGRATDEGLTHRGRVLGAAIGPGAQSQHLAVDVLGPGPEPRPEWRFGLVLGRIRWENDTFSRLPAMTPFSHDTSFLAGLRAAAEAAGFRAEAQILYQLRLNYLFQNGQNRPAGLRTVDVTNWTLGLSLRPVGDRS